MKRLLLGILLACILASNTALASDVPGWLRVNDGNQSPSQKTNQTPAYATGTHIPAMEIVNTWTPISAVLNQKMATRTGPGTIYTEDLGTHSRDTRIVVFQQEMGGSVPWGLVEFEYKGGLYRAYTGMKRIDASSIPPWADGPKTATIAEHTTLWYGPGTKYVPMKHTLPIGTSVEVYGNEQGFALIDYQSPNASDKRVRSWIPLTALQGYFPR